YPTQTFAAYANGHLMHTGPTNMGRKKDPTPTGLFFTNWKAEETTSTFNDEWDLKWNFNIENKLGVGFHQYSLPGYPASHSCLRLQERDAKYLYEFADQWELADKETVKVKGTPVVVFGTYDFDGKKPWLQVVKSPKALAISEEEIDKIVNPFMENIMKEQKNRMTFVSQSK
ncbi:MAG: L,D-transpeptidase, partial [Flavobacterium sp.]|nr:L,D-transpeptidase [Flavobacterium sp.]